MSAIELGQEVARDPFRAILSGANVQGRDCLQGVL